MAIQAAEVQEKARACCMNPKLLITYLWFITLVRPSACVFVCALRYPQSQTERLTHRTRTVAIVRHTQVFGFMYALAAIVAAVNNNGDGEADSKSLGFVGVWAMFLIIGLSVGGTMVMRKYQTPLAVGFFIGVVIMMSLQMFSLSVLFAGAAYLARQERDKGNEHTSVYSNDAGSIFSFFMFVLYVRPLRWSTACKPARASVYRCRTHVCLNVPLQLAFSIVLIKHRTVIIKEGVPLDPNAVSGSMAAEKTAASTAVASPKVVRTDLEAGKSLAPPVSV